MPILINFCGLINGGEYIDNLSSIGRFQFLRKAVSNKVLKKEV